MAATVSLDGYGVLSNAESTTNWGAIGAGVTVVLEQDIYLQGSAACSVKVSNKVGAIYYDLLTGNELDFTSSSAEEGQYVYIWFNVTTLGILDTYSNGGLRVIMGTDQYNYATWAIAGSDRTEVINSSKGGFICVAVDPRKAPTEINIGTWDPSSVKIFGIYVDTTGLAKAENVIVDTIAVMRGIKVTGTDTNGWDDVIDYCTDYSNRAWGVIQKDASGEFNLVQGRITIGDTNQTGNTSFTTAGRIFKWISFDYSPRSGSPSYNPLLPYDECGLFIEDNSSYTTTYIDGNVVGIDEGRLGSTFIGDSVSQTRMSLEGGDNSASITKLYGCTIKDMTGIIDLGSDTAHHYYSCNFDGCGQILSSGPVMRNCIIQNTVAIYKYTLDAGISYDNPTYTDETTETNDDTIDDMTLMPSATPVINDAFYFGSEFQFDKLELNITTAATPTTDIRWEYYTSGGWVQMPGGAKYDTTKAFTNPGLAVIDLIGYGINYTNWIPTTINGQGPYYYIRARTGSTGGTGPAYGQKARVFPYGSGGALKWASGLDIEDSKFIANIGQTYNIAGAIQHDSSGDFDYEGLTFSFNEYDILNFADATVDSEYAWSNQDGTYQLYYGLQGASQSFDTGASSGVLSRAQFYMYQSGTPAGNIVANLYAHSGTFGSSSIPTGDPLATSNAVAADSLPTSIGVVDFEFEDEYTMSAYTNYVIAVEYDDEGPVYIGYDGTSPIHSGNAATTNGTTWTPDNTKDLVHRVLIGAVVHVTNLDGANASTAVELGEPPSATKIETPVVVTVHVEDTSGSNIQNAQTYIADSATGTIVLMNEDTNSSGIATENFIYTSDLDVIVRVRKSSTGDTRYVDYETTGTVTSTGYYVNVVLREDPNIA